MIKWLELTRDDGIKFTINTDTDLLRFYEEEQICYVVLTDSGMPIQETYSYLKGLLDTYPPAAETKPESRVMFCEKCEMFLDTVLNDCVTCGTLLKKAAFDANR